MDERVNIEPTFDIDVVVTYVDCTDPEWQQSYSKYYDLKSLPACRYRSLDTLRYFFRGIDKNMPWVRKVFFIVNSKSQIPDWLDVNNDKIKVVYLSDYMPEQLVPSFNSNQIELFLYRIPELAEHFICFNDDMVCINPCKKSDFFDADGRIKVDLSPREYTTNNKWRHTLYNGVLLLKKYYPDFDGYNVVDHYIHVLLKSFCAELVEKELDYILNIFSKSKLRTYDDVTIYMIREYIALKGYACERTLKFGYIPLDDDMDTIDLSDEKIICLNDTEQLTYAATRVQHLINETLMEYLPDKSSFEL